jgi:hypothetical protein
MRKLSTRLSGAGFAVLLLCLVFLTATAVAVAGNGNGTNGNGNGNNGNGNGNGGSNNSGKGNEKDKQKDAPASAPATGSSAPATPPGQANKPATPPGQSADKPGATPATPATPASGGSPATPATPATPAGSAAPTPVPAATAPVIGESMGVKPLDGKVQVRLPDSSGYVSLAAAGSIPPGAVVDARKGTLVLRTAIDSEGGTQTAKVRGALFEVRQAADGHGMTELVLRDGRPKSCDATGSAAIARAATTHAIPTESKKHATGLWAKDKNGRFKTRGRNSVATVRGTRWVTRETCAGTLTRVMQGAVDVFDLRKHRTVRVRAGHSYLARTSG